MMHSIIMSKLYDNRNLSDLKYPKIQHRQYQMIYFDDLQIRILLLVIVDWSVHEGITNTRF